MYVNTLKQDGRHFKFKLPPWRFNSEKQALENKGASDVQNCMPNILFHVKVWVLNCKTKASFNCTRNSDEKGNTNQKGIQLSFFGCSVYPQIM